MNGPVFDSNQYANELKEAGLSAPVVQAFVALKLEVHGVHVEMNHRFDKMENRVDVLEKSFDAKLSGLKGELIAWMSGLVFVQLGATFAIIRMALPG